MVYWQKRLWNDFCGQGSSRFGSSFTLFIYSNSGIFRKPASQTLIQYWISPSRPGIRWRKGIQFVCANEGNNQIIIVIILLKNINHSSSLMDVMMLCYFAARLFRVCICSLINPFVRMFSITYSVQFRFLSHDSLLRHSIISIFFPLTFSDFIPSFFFIWLAFPLIFSFKLLHFLSRFSFSAFPFKLSV